MYIVNADGTGFENLTRDGVSGQAAWSADGEWIVFSSRREGGSAGLYRMRPDGGGVQRLTTLEQSAEAPLPSPDGSRIAFWDFSAHREGSLWMLELESGRSVNVGTPAGSAIAWSPDGEMFATANTVYTRDGAFLRGLPDAQGGGNVFGDGVAWSPDGELIGLWRGAFSAGVVQIVGARDEAFQRDVAYQGNVDGMAFAPDGSLVIWGSILFRFGRDGRELGVLARDAVEPSWSADGRRLAFVGHRLEPYANWIAVADADGQNARRVSPVLDAEFTSGGYVSLAGWQPRP